ncbi:pilus assembly protein [Xenorhabdus sp. XENO-1]|uniref:MrpH family fimbial adhesin n=1 Tax=Xenorhabdus bovienii TaxID=40576 RepID=UPI0020CA802D|nr:pilus assembly protein [Xenorhabdus bovienii]MCP9268690.1 pilus assembly protein [Xenorhabdus bovienii subsp. africana]
MRHIKKSLMKFVALLFFLSASYAYAGAYVMAVNTEPLGNQAVTTMEIIAWTEEEGIPNPCYGSSRCYVGPDVFYKNGYKPGMYGSCIGAGACLDDANRYSTTAEVMRAYKRKLGIPFRTTFTIISGDADCVGLYYSKQISSGYGSAQQFPNSTCGKLPPKNQNCSISVPSEIAYGALKASDVNNATRSITGQVKCALKGDFRLEGFSTDREAKIYLDSNRQMYSTLQINGWEAMDGVLFKAKGRDQPENFTLTSILRTITPPKAGKYEGIAVVLLSYH